MPVACCKLLTNNYQVVVGATVIGRLIGWILGQHGLGYHQIILLSARRMHRRVACLIIALDLLRLHGHAKFAEVVSVRRERKKDTLNYSTGFACPTCHLTHSIMLALGVDLMQMV